MDGTRDQGSNNDIDIQTTPLSRTSFGTPMSVPQSSSISSTSHSPEDLLAEVQLGKEVILELLQMGNLTFNDVYLKQEALFVLGLTQQRLQMVHLLCSDAYHQSQSKIAPIHPLARMATLTLIMAATLLETTPL